ncbi:site-specific DNA-methyltransferase [Lactobacillus sp. ESL0236]|uniref:site-specific DNA-methyltransferase n=1 Tax=unclassified Lactobacillus TaxID=2620435 RepID=UPI000EFC2EA3|nr:MULTISPECIES: site-specific DNA-methyltransferase [unclassified Lactobacillus]RMC40704.1 site-specific DNA-methyltransferase [Lactobacillus sp. ESL0237]RMC44462.1 site-specific DNA-methyltransferase [Lactobacillus sp. ESL0234]RMC45768.1 site-specific DNA-methyltransferase [Lactobacillus sp. ESL0236]
MQTDNEKYNDTVQPNTAFLNELKEKLPEFFTKDGSFDLDKFRNQLKDKNVNELSEGYQLDFIGKDYARRQAGEMPHTVIVPNEKQNQGEGKNSKNLFFTGDNLEVLRHLQTSYQNKIDVIYIDPPYNTGSDGFVYPDSFEYSDDKLKEMFGLDDDQVERLKSIQGNSSHSAWLTFMYPRLVLAKRLLSDKGIIFVSIDDNESADVTMLMNSIFGEQQFKVQFIWTKTETPPALSNYSRRTTEYVLSFEKNSYGEKYYGSKLENSDVPLINGRNAERKVIFPTDSCIFYKYNDATITSQQFSKIELLDTIQIEKGRNIAPFTVKGSIRWTQETVNDEANKGTVFLFKSTDLNPRFLRKDANGKYRTPNTNLNKELGILTNEDGVKRLNELNLKNMFTNPKPTSLVKYLINIVGHEHPYITVMDFFAGSSTTADAVMQLNAEDGGHRKFIMVQLPEKPYHTNKDGNEIPTKGGKEAYDAGFKSIDQISRERIRRAAKKIREDNELTLPEDFDGSFKHYRVVKPVKQTLEEIEDFDPDNTNLFTNMVDGFSSQVLNIDGDATGEETILTTWLAKDGYSFDTNVEEIKFGNYSAHQVGDNRLYLINEGWGADQTRELLNQLGTHQLEVQSVVIFGYSFNVAELRELENGLKQLNSKVTLIKRY